MAANNIGEQYATWNPFGGRIYKADSDGPAKFATAATVGIFATNRATYDADALSTSRIIGLIQDWNLSQAKQAPQIFECGSNGRYTLATGRVSGSMTISRVLYSGANLLWLLYGGANPSGIPSQSDLTDVAGYHAEATATDPARGFAINLASSAFMNALGIGIVIKTATATPSGPGANEFTYAAFFLEECFINSHGMGASAGAPYVGEQVSMTFEAVVPLNVNTGDTQWGNAS